MVSQAVYGHVITKFSRMGRLLHFLTHGAPLARFARESSANKVSVYFIMGRCATTTTATATASGNNLVIIASGPRSKKLKEFI